MEGSGAGGVEGGASAHGPRRLMGNYFRQIYTGSGAEWWTSTLAGHRGGFFLFFLWVSLGWVVVGGWRGWAG